MMDDRVRHRHAAARLMMLQRAGKPSPIEVTTAMLVALQHGMLDAVPLEKVHKCCERLSTLLANDGAVAARLRELSGSHLDAVSVESVRALVGDATRDLGDGR